MKRVVIDTNILVAALRSSLGASHRLLRAVGTSRFDIVLSVPLVLEYEEVLKRQARALGLNAADVDAIVDFLCSVGEHRRIFFLWRPILRDPSDDMILELAVESHCDAIVTFNSRDFAGADRFGIRVMPPREFVRELGGLE